MRELCIIVAEHTIGEKCDLFLVMGTYGTILLLSWCFLEARQFGAKPVLRV